MNYRIRLLLSCCLAVIPVVLSAQTPCAWNETQSTQVSVPCPVLVQNSAGAAEVTLSGASTAPGSGLRIVGDRHWKLGASIADSGGQKFAIADFTIAPAVARFVIDSSGNVGLNAPSPWAGLHLRGAGQTSSNPTFTSASAAQNGASLFLQDTTPTGGAGGMVVFGATAGAWASIKGVLTDGSNNTLGHLTFATRNVSTDPFLTERMRISSEGRVMIGTTVPKGMLHVFRSNPNETIFWTVLEATVSDNTSVSGRGEVVFASQ